MNGRILSGGLMTAAAVMSAGGGVVSMNIPLNPARARIKKLGLRWRFILFQICLGCLGIGCQPMSNRGRVIVIAGASSGFGKGVSLKLADQGAHLVLAARRTQLLEDLAAECRRRGAQAIVVTTDVSDPQQVERLCRTAVGKFGRIDVWINMAGVGAIGRFDEIPLNDHLRLVDINLKGVISGSHYAVAQFRRQGCGTLINVASVAGEIPVPYFSSYCASKHAIIGLDTAINGELQVNHERGIRVCTVLPYAADTPWWEHAANYSGHTAWLPAMDPPEVVVDAIVQATLRPQERVTPGTAGIVLVARRLFPDATNAIARDAAESSMVHSPPATQSAGSLYQPMESGTGVEGGVRERMREYRRTRH